MSLHDGQSPLWARLPNQGSQSGDHWAVACRTALPKIPCVSLRLCCIGSVWCRRRPVCKETSFFIRCSFFFLSLSLSVPVSPLAVLLWPLSLLLISKFGIYLFNVCLPCPCVCVCLGPAALSLSPYSTSSVWPPMGSIVVVCAHVLLLCVIEHLFEINGISIATHTYTDPLHFPIIAVS